MKIHHKFFLYQNKLLQPYFRILLGFKAVITYLASLLLIAGVVYEHGFPHTALHVSEIHLLYKAVWIIFLADVTLHILLEYTHTKKNFSKLTWVLSCFLYLTLIPVIFHKPLDNGGVLLVWEFLGSQFYHVLLLLLFAFLNLSNGFVRLLGRRTNPSLILAVSFLVIILIGTGLLMLPRSTFYGISWVDSLFISTSSVCITGLTPFDLATTFTPGGLIIIIILVQIGGLGVMTLTSFFALFFMGNTSIYNQLVVGDMVSSNSLGSLLSTLLYILGFTLAIEGVGMLVIWLSIHDTLGMSFEQELAFSAFHSISAFCNAGFSTLPGNLGNPMVITGHNSLYIAISMLVIFGGIGFPILVNFKEIALYRLRHIRSLIDKSKPHKGRLRHIYNLNTKIVLIVTLLLIVCGTLAIAWLEWNGSFAGMSIDAKWTQAFFTATSPRSSGFTSVNFSTLSMQTLMIYMLFMWIGGGSQSTAGGVKVNAFSVVILNLVAVVRGTERVEIFGREISNNSIRRSNATVTMSLVTLFVALFILTLLEPDLPLISLVFECISALCTVGSSLNITHLLGTEGKLLIALLMFVGRVGLITLMLGIITQKKNTKYRYPSDNIIIN